MDTNIKLSIIVTTYNVEKYIDRCLSDVLDQTIDNFEVIVVDDGSKDSTPQIVKNFAIRDKRIKPILMEVNSPGGVATAANVGLNAAVGEWVGFADGDDMFKPDMFEKLVAAAESSQADISICKFLEWDNLSEREYRPWDPHWDWLYKNNVVDLTRFDDKINFLKLNPVPWRKLYRRSFLESNNIRFDECDYFFEDNSFHWFVTLNANKVSYVNEELCYHRMNRAGQTMKVGGKGLLDVFYQFDVIKGYLLSKGLLDRYRKPLLEWLVNQTDWIANNIDVNLAQYFYDTLSEKYEIFSVGELRKALKYRSRKISLLLFSVKNKHTKYFKRILQGSQNLPFWREISYQYFRLGLLKIILLPIYKAKEKRKNKYFELEKRLSGMHYELSEMRKLLELCLLYQDQSVEKFRQDLNGELENMRK